MPLFLTVCMIKGSLTFDLLERLGFCHHDPNQTIYQREAFQPVFNAGELCLPVHDPFAGRLIQSHEPLSFDQALLQCVLSAAFQNDNDVFDESCSLFTIWRRMNVAGNGVTQPFMKRSFADPVQKSVKRRSHRAPSSA